MNTNINEIGAMLATYPNSIGYVVFKKQDGSIRKMRFRRNVKQGSTPLRGGEWANGNAKSTDYHIICVTDMDLEDKNEYSRRSFKLDDVLQLKIGGEIWVKSKH